MRSINLFYDAEGDVLEIKFGSGMKDQRTGIGLTSQVTLFCDHRYERVLGLTIVAYSRLIALGAQPLSELSQAPAEIQEKVKNLLQTKPACLMLTIRNNDLQLEDLHVSKWVAA